MSHRSSEKYFRRLPRSGDRPSSRFDRRPRTPDEPAASTARAPRDGWPAPTEPTDESSTGNGSTEAAPNIQQPIRTWTLARTKYYIEKTKDMALFSTDHLLEYGQLMLYSGALLLLGLASSPGATIFVFLVWLIFFRIADTKRLGRTGLASRFISGTIHFVLHLTLMWSLYSWLTYWNQETLLPYLQQVSRDWGGDGTFLLLAPVEVWTRAAYIPQMVIVGGIAAGLLFGLYLTITYIFGRVNTDWVFSAQGSPDYRNFLRMKLEPNRLTIYPIGLDRPPQRRWWWPFSAAVAWGVANEPKPHEPKVQPRAALRPRLIEGPIVINANEVQNIPRG